jgi:hypothetical protein
MSSPVPETRPEPYSQATAHPATTHIESWPPGVPVVTAEAVHSVLSGVAGFDGLRADSLLAGGSWRRAWNVPRIALTRNFLAAPTWPV